MRFRNRGLKLKPLCLNLFMYGLFNATVNSSGYVASIIMINNELESSHLLGGTEKNHGKPQLW
jgi:hypothetical protein